MVDTVNGSATVRREIVWRGLADATMEHVSVTLGDDLEADGWIVGVVGGEPIRLHYRLQIKNHHDDLEVMVTDEVSLYGYVLRKTAALWELLALRNAKMPLLEGCTDVDLIITPLTNTLPIRRLNLKAGGSARIAVAYMDIPSFNLRRADQRYTCLSRADDISRYRFESLDGENVTFSAELTVDADGLVIDYEGLFTRIWER